MKLFRKKYKELSDEALMALIKDGSESAFDELYHRYSARLYAFFYKMLYQDQELANDFCQTLFLKVFEKASSFNKAHKFSTWLYTIASNLCKNEYRRNDRRTPVLLIQKQQLKSEQPKGPTLVDNEIFRRKLQIAINKLDEKHRICFVLRYQEEKPINEISTILDCPAGTVKSRLHYTLKKLAEELYQFNPNYQNITNERIVK